MPYGFLDIAITPSVRAAEASMGSEHLWQDFKGHRKPKPSSLPRGTASTWPPSRRADGPISNTAAARQASCASWMRRLACADFRGNRQHASLGNLAANDRASLFLMDYAGQRRLKIRARVEVVDLTDVPDLAAELAHPGYKAKIERVFIFHLEAFDWNCAQHITPRFTVAQIEEGLGTMRDGIVKLEAENVALRARLES
jgi:hypothetical protein